MKTDLKTYWTIKDWLDTDVVFNGEYINCALCGEIKDFKEKALDEYKDILNSIVDVEKTNESRLLHINSENVTSEEFESFAFAKAGYISEKKYDELFN